MVVVNGDRTNPDELKRPAKQVATNDMIATKNKDRMVSQHQKKQSEKKAALANKKRVLAAMDKDGYDCLITFNNPKDSSTVNVVSARPKIADETSSSTAKPTPQTNCSRFTLLPGKSNYVFAEIGAVFGFDFGDNIERPNFTCSFGRIQKHTIVHHPFHKTRGRSKTRRQQQATSTTEEEYKAIEEASVVEAMSNQHTDGDGDVGMHGGTM